MKYVRVCISSVESTNPLAPRGGSSIPEGGSSIQEGGLSIHCFDATGGGLSNPMVGLPKEDEKAIKTGYKKFDVKIETYEKAFAKINRPRDQAVPNVAWGPRASRGP